MPGIAASNSSATVRSCTAEFWRMSSRARWKPKQSTARRSSRKPPARDHARIVRDQRAVEHVEIGLELPDTGIGLCLADRPSHDLDVELLRRRREPRIDAGDRQTIGLAAPVRRGVGRALGERAQLVGDVGEMGRDRQLRAERMQLLQIELQHAARLQPQRAAHHVGRDERIAVAVAADPAPHPQERGDLARRRVTRR